MKSTISVLFLLFFPLLSLFAQGEEALIKKVKARLNRVADYEARGRMKIDVSFINAPESEVTVYFKKPDKFRVVKKDGISLLPRGGVSVNMGTLLPDADYTAVGAGQSTVGGTPVKVIKLLPLSEKSDVVLTTLFIDEKNEVVRRAVVTTRENGTYEMEMSYGRFLSWGLPDKVLFSFNAKDYKLPKGLTFEYEKGGKKTPPPKDAKGRVEITYSSYAINKGISDAVFR
jgi:hypothetical protein